MANKKAFARYANNKIVPGSLILSDKAPKVGVWKEVVYDLCCGGSQNCTPPLYTPIELCYNSEDSSCNGECEVGTYYIFQAIVFGIPIVRLLNSENALDVANAGFYKITSLENQQVIVVGPGGQMVFVLPCQPTSTTSTTTTELP